MVMERMAYERNRKCMAIGRMVFRKSRKCAVMDCMTKKYVILCLKIQYLDKLFLCGWQNTFEYSTFWNNAFDYDGTVFLGVWRNVE